MSETGPFKPVHREVFRGASRTACSECRNPIKSGTQTITVARGKKGSKRYNGAVGKFRFCCLNCYKKCFERHIEYYLQGGKEESERLCLLNRLDSLAKHDELWPESKKGNEAERQRIKARLEELAQADKPWLSDK